jgi:hypothetical protein
MNDKVQYIKPETDRRKASSIVDNERRVSERVAILEIHVRNNTKQLEDSQDDMTKVIDRLDAHILVTAERDALLQTSLLNVTNAVTMLSTNIINTNDTLKTISTLVNSSSSNWAQLHTTISVIAKITAGTVIVVSGLWAVFSFAIEHAPSKTSNTPAIIQSIVPNGPKTLTDLKKPVIE